MSRVLVVEDESAIAELISINLRHAGYEVTLSASSEQAQAAVDYVAATGSKTQIETSKIEDALKEKNIRVNLDSFVDESTIRRVKGVIREIYSEKGYNDVEKFKENTLFGAPLKPEIKAKMIADFEKIKAGY